MNSSLKAVLLDLDGTLLDTAPDFAFIINFMLQKYDRPTIGYAQFRQSVSDGARGMIQMAFACGDDDPQFEALREEFLSLYTQHIADHTELFPGMAELLQYIEGAGLSWGVVTNKASVYAVPLMQAMSLSPRCTTLVCPDHVAHRKPDPEALQLACRQIGCDTNEAIYIGDHRRDIEAGRNAGMSTIACSYGYVHGDDPCENWGAEFIVHDPRQIITILQQWMG
ncbi:MAG TPA: HAD-IA family hydrolase [Spongiibacteraceae bacterium]|nr:HAD-IA family hydrolase [Spongiibacteraceae bacterium]